MGIFNNFPWSNYQQLNLDWIIRTIKNLVDKTEKTVSVEPQVLSNSEKEQARNNIGAGTGEGAVRFDIEQNLTTEQKYRAISNIDALPANSVESEIARRAVMYDQEQTLTESQKARARENIGISQSGQTGAVLYNENQNLSTEEKYQARVNIDAIDQEGVLLNVNNNAVMYTASQSIPDAQKEQARNNIDVYSKEETNSAISSASQNVVKNIPQTFTDEQKEQARDNIDVYSKEETDNAIGSASGFTPTLVWTNPNVGNTFGTADANSSVDIEVNLTNVKFVLIDFKVFGSVYSDMIMFNAGSTILRAPCVGMSNEIVCSRRVKILKSENKINFGYASSNGDTNNYYTNSVAIPHHIYVIY